MKLRPIINKKGSIVDIIFLIITLLGLAILIIVMMKVFPAITAQLKVSAINESAGSVAALDKTDSIVFGLDYIFLVIFAGLSIGIFITSYKIDSSPGLMVVYIILLALLVAISAIMQFVYGSFSTANELAGLASTYSPMMDNIMSHLIIASIGVGIVSFVLIFAKPRGGGGY
jgi:hypothetical protein